MGGEHVFEIDVSKKLEITINNKKPVALTGMGLSASGAIRMLLTRGAAAKVKVKGLNAWIA